MPSRDLSLQHQAPFLEVVAREDCVDRIEHVLGRDVRQEAEPPAIDSEQRHAALGDVPSRVQQRTVAADRDNEVDALGELRLGNCLEPVAERLGFRLPRREDLDTALTQMSDDLLRGFRNAWLAQTSPQADRFELLRHPFEFS